MYQSSARKNFLDILLDPTAIAIVASLALHTIIGAGLPYFTRPEFGGKKAGPTTVKVVELTPGELQRIPQAPPVPTPQAVPSPTPSVAPSPATPPPRVTKFSTAPQTIPFSPIRPSDGTLFQPPATKKQKAAPKKQPASPLFDPNAIFSPPKSPQPQSRKGAISTPSLSPPVTTKPPAKKPKKKRQSRKGTTFTPSPSLSPPVTNQPPARKPTKLVVPLPNAQTDDDGGNNPPAQTPSANNPNNRQAQQSSGAKPSTDTNPSNSTSTAPTEPANTSGDSGGGGFYGRYTQEALKRLIDYKRNIPGLVVYQTAVLKVDYPAKAACTSVKQSPYIVYMVAFDKVAEIAPDDFTSERLTQTVDKSAIYGDKGNAQLFRYAAFKATEASTTADLNRPAADKGKRVLYQYRIEFNPASCKK